MNSRYEIPLQKPRVTPRELDYVRDAICATQLAGDGVYTEKCHAWIEKTFKTGKVLLTTSCTTALEMAAHLLNVQAGHEIIVPSFTFVSSINPFVTRGARPVFVDIRKDTLNIDETLIGRAITNRTRAIVPVHYASVSNEMDLIMSIARDHCLYVVEDAACAFGARYKGRYLGTIGDIGCYSFHQTKNVTCGEGGAIVLNNEAFIERAEIIRDKGTNRSRFLRGEIDKYTWMDVGSSMLPSDILAAFLLAQFEHMEETTRRKKMLFETYCEHLGALQQKGALRLPCIPLGCEIHFDNFYILLPNETTRDRLMTTLNRQGIGATFHYLPLHLSPMGSRFGYKKGDLPVTERISDTILRLPLYYDLSLDDQMKIIESIYRFFGHERC